ncbi:sensor histidine kinase [Halorussus halophilus]|uniref:sensor histidine kinase n=1 Tax=Halorussus halophilus TaxID=2650975 RepID=UPI001F2EC47E|nr:PAS domain S-box protein [Halorussus halophilus]
MYREIYDKVNDGIVIHDPDTGAILDVNKRATEIYGYSEAELVNLQVEDFSAADEGFDQEHAIAHIDRAREEGDHRFEWLLDPNDGERFWAEINLRNATIRGEDRILAIVRDISEQKAYERRLETAEKRFRALAENASFAVVTIDDTSTIRYANEAVSDMFGYRPDELEGDSIESIIPERLRDDHTDGIERYLEEGTRHIDWEGLELPGRHRDGHELVLEVSFGELEVEDERLFTGILQDVSERVERERAIESLHDATREMVRADDPQEIADIAVRTAHSILDYPICGLWVSDESGERLEPLAWTDEAEAFFDEIPAVTAAADSVAWQAYEQNELVAYDDVRTANAVYNPETRARSEMFIPVGERGLLIISAQVEEAFTEADHSLACLLGANVEVGLERAEQVQELSRQKNRLEFLNSLLRHDVLNGMNIIAGYADLLEDHVEDDEQAASHVETIQSWSDDIVDLIQRVRTMLDVLTGRTSPEVEPKTLAPVLRDEVRRLRKTHSTVDIDLNVADGVHVQADEFLPEIVGNLLTNAVNHNDTEGLRIDISADVSDGVVQIRIADTGSGVPEELKDAIFHRGKTGETDNSGSGFGLFFAETMVTEYGGDIWVEDNEPSGAVFVVELQNSGGSRGTGGASWEQ